MSKPQNEHRICVSQDKEIRVSEEGGCQKTLSQCMEFPTASPGVCSLSWCVQRLIPLVLDLSKLRPFDKPFPLLIGTNLFIDATATTSSQALGCCCENRIEANYCKQALDTAVMRFGQLEKRRGKDYRLHIVPKQL